jgi:hypothetical protein
VTTTSVEYSTHGSVSKPLLQAPRHNAQTMQKIRKTRVRGFFKCVPSAPPQALMPSLSLFVRLNVYRHLHGIATNNSERRQGL